MVGTFAVPALLHPAGIQIVIQPLKILLLKLRRPIQGQDQLLQIIRTPVPIAFLQESMEQIEDLSLLLLAGPGEYLP